MAPRLKFTTWMCQLGGQMCSYHAIYHANTLAVELSTELREISQCQEENVFTRAFSLLPISAFTKEKALVGASVQCVSRSPVDCCNCSRHHIYLAELVKGRPDYTYLSIKKLAYSPTLHLTRKKDTIINIVCVFLYDSL